MKLKDKVRVQLGFNINKDKYEKNVLVNYYLNALPTVTLLWIKGTDIVKSHLRVHCNGLDKSLKFLKVCIF